MLAQQYAQYYNVFPSVAGASKPEIICQCSPSHSVLSYPTTNVSEIRAIVSEVLAIHSSQYTLPTLTITLPAETPIPETITVHAAKTVTVTERLSNTIHPTRDPDRDHAARKRVLTTGDYLDPEFLDTWGPVSRPVMVALGYGVRWAEGIVESVFIVIMPVLMILMVVIGIVFIGMLAFIFWEECVKSSAKRKQRQNMRAGEKKTIKGR
ncbi:hypothetical protein BJ508DRAFT_314125 [Ascobolus immersus RN42]|uniref:Uncharacterized protein n=1 Tax=Ascobolus immersus RN42 TaxID=1160509 RepID=A0A3N4HGC0_ASCIM|nr:hypothetical protein BJ508DRAFT_314125 [Ascobolus immersus RN42]